MNWTEFDAVFRGKVDYTLDHKVVEAITRQRKEAGTLYFDRICSSIGYNQASRLYPPKSNTELRNLWQNIIKTDVADEKKQAVLFYILRDCKQPSNIDSTFARKTYLPLKYQILVTGLHELDKGQYSRALEHLTDPSLTPEFADDILLTLISSSRCDDSLAMAYFLTVSPPLKKKETMESYFQLLLHTNVVEAYKFTQKQDMSPRRTMFERMLKFVLDERSSPTKAQRTTLALSLPLSADEEAWFEDFLLQGDGSDLPGARDSVIMRRLSLGRSIDGMGNLSGFRGTKMNGLDWDDIRLMHKRAIPDMG